MLNRVELLNLSLFLHFQTNSCILQIRLLIMLIEKRTCCKTTSISWSTSINDVVKSSMKQSGSQHSLIRPRIDLARSDGLFHAALMGADACEALATFTQDAYIIHIYIPLPGIDVQDDVYHPCLQGALAASPSPQRAAWTPEMATTGWWSTGDIVTLLEIGIPSDPLPKSLAKCDDHCSEQHSAEVRHLEMFLSFEVFKSPLGGLPCRPFQISKKPWSSCGTIATQWLRCAAQNYPAW